MISFIVSLVALVLGYFIYGRIVERIFGPDDRPTPAVAKADGVDFIVLPHWKIFMIQFLNIAGTGPIFGAIMGMKFGPAAYLWIVFGCIFAGATHDYLTGMMSLRNDGKGLPELIGIYHGNNSKRLLLVFCVLLLILVGAVFIYSPAIILSGITNSNPDNSFSSTMIWAGVIFIYYLIATMLPIDKVIGRIYPIFAFSLIFMAIALMLVLFIKWPSLPEIWDNLSYANEKTGPLFPCLFITVACGAISGFHATQSPLMARCMSHERQGRPIFYGAMITEGIIALIWATIASYFLYDGGYSEVGSDLSATAPQVVQKISTSWLGMFGGFLAILGVVAAPITTGDTALRSARLIIAEFLKIEQKTVRKRFYICIPIFALTGAILWYNIADPDGFDMIWGYFGWTNQSLSIFSLWTITIYLAQKRKPYIITLIPAIFMTSVCSTYLIVAKNALGLNENIGYVVAIGVAIISTICFIIWMRKNRSNFTNEV